MKNPDTFYCSKTAPISTSPALTTPLSRVVTVLLKQHLLTLEGDPLPVGVLRATSWRLLGTDKKYCQTFMSFDNERHSMFKKTQHWDKALLVIKDRNRRIEDLTPQEVNICISSFYLLLLSSS